MRFKTRAITRVMKGRGGREGAAGDTISQSKILTRSQSQWQVFLEIPVPATTKIPIEVMVGEKYN